MGLSDTVKDLQKKAESKGLQLLKEMRRFTALHTADAMEKDYARILKVYDSPKGFTADGQRWICREMAEHNRTGRLRKVYEETLQGAARAERREKGGGEALVARHWDELQNALAGIEKMYQEEKKWQLEIEG